MNTTKVLKVIKVGDITPCALFNKVITNLNNKSVSEAQEEYVSSEIIRNLLAKNFYGKCKGCQDFLRCGGGCRAVVYGHSGGYMADDPSCFRELL